MAEVSDWPQRNEPPQTIRAGSPAAGARAGARKFGCTADAPSAGADPIRAMAVVLHASRLSGPRRNGQIAVILEPASPAEVMPLVLQAYALTDREAEVAQLVLRGNSTAEITANLCITALTVQQHLKSVFDKTGCM